MKKPLHFFAAGEDGRCSDKARLTALSRHRIRIRSRSPRLRIAYTCRLGLSVVKKPLIDANIFSADDLGKIGSTCSTPTAVGKLVNGFLADHATSTVFVHGHFRVSRDQHFHGWSPCCGLDRAVGLNGWFQSFVPRRGLCPCRNGSATGNAPVLRNLEHGHPVGEGLTYVASAGVVAFFAGGPASRSRHRERRARRWVILSFRTGRGLRLPTVADWKERPRCPAGCRRCPAKSTWQTQLSI